MCIFAGWIDLLFYTYLGVVPFLLTSNFRWFLMYAQPIILMIIYRCAKILRIGYLTCSLFPLCFEECPTTDLELINGDFNGPAIKVGDNLNFTCHQGFSKPNVTLTCLSSGKIKNAEQMACCES